MKVTKYETNQKKNYYYNKTDIKTKRNWFVVDRLVVNIYPDVIYQQFQGFGACITEAAAYSYSLLPEAKKKEYMQDMFSNINYSLCRLPLGSCDFSLKSYSYSYKHDLSDFSIEKDKKYIIPFIQDALKVNPNIKFLASPWSPPKFMKNTKMLILGGKLLKKYKQTYAEYFVKYIKSYKDLGINIDYVTIQNETNGMPIWESCLYNPKDEVDFLTNYLYPTFCKNDIDTKILVYDHNKEKLFNRAVAEFSNEEANKAAAGIAFHWYSGNHFENLQLCREKFPDKLLFHTEGCFSYDPNNSFSNQYAHDIIEDLNAGVNGYIDWNILLDSKGGPNHKKNYCNSPVMLLPDNSNYNKSLTYYYIGHFSKFIKPGAVRIAHSKYLSDLHVTAFKNPDGTIAVVMFNGVHYGIDVNVCIGDKRIKDTIEGESMVTYVIE
ncbi:MAG: glucosylceramidase [Clostridia bacterium]|nr:glucosylceramidase [Clostridia bacterium]